MSKLVALYESFRAAASHFRSDKRANVAIIFGLSVVPIIGAIGAAIDYGRATDARSGLQAALDSAALTLSKDASKITQAQLQSKADTIVKANLHDLNISSLTITPTFAETSPGSYVLTLKASGTLPTTIAGIWKPTMSIGSSSEVVWGMKRLELALALDNTGSMSSSGKMTQLKLASKKLLDTLQKAAKKPDDVKISIIPFDIGVNIGTSYANNDWFDYDSLDCNGGQSGTGCNANNWKSFWTGCVRDRTYPNDAQDTPPSNAATKFPVSTSCGSLARMMPLTNDWTALNLKIDQMTPNGNTNVTIGLAWGWHSLTAGVPLSEASAPKQDLDKVIILLTDGDNTESWKNSNNTKVTSASAIDARTLLACTNAKADNIRIYTVRVINGNANLLRDCATNPTMFYDVKNADELVNVFSAIAQNLANLRVSK